MCSGPFEFSQLDGIMRKINLLCCLFFQPEEATEPTSTLVPFLQKYSDTRNKKPSVSVKNTVMGGASHKPMRSIPLEQQKYTGLMSLSEVASASRQVGRACAWFIWRARRLLIVCSFSPSVSTCSVLSSGAEAGTEGNQRAAGPSLPLHELPEARRGRPCASVLPRSW